MANTRNTDNNSCKGISGIQAAIKGWLRYTLKKTVYFEGRFITERKYVRTLSNRYIKMLKELKEGQEYFTWV